MAETVPSLDDLGKLTKGAEPEVEIQVAEPKLDKFGRAYATGRRPWSVCRGRRASGRSQPCAASAMLFFRFMPAMSRACGDCAWCGWSGPL